MNKIGSGNLYEENYKIPSKNINAAQIAMGVTMGNAQNGKTNV